MLWRFCKQLQIRPSALNIRKWFRNDLIVIFVHNVPHLVSFRHTNRQSVVLKNRNHLADMADVFVCGVLKPRDCPALLPKLPRRWC